VVYTRSPWFYSDPFHTDDLDEFRMKDSADVEYTFYDLRKFVRLAALQNPNILETFWCPDDCIVSSVTIDGVSRATDGAGKEAWAHVKGHASMFVTKNCSATFVNYAKQQIVKAKGQDKFQNMEKDRKTPIDFCRVWAHSGSMPLTEWLELSGYRADRVGLAKCDGMRDGYSLFHDTYLENLGYQGVCREGANDVALSSIPKGKEPLAFMQFNKDAYSIHCGKYRDYQHWLANRNEDRWVTVKSHGQNIDGKNMLHCIRLLMMARDIAAGQGVIVRRSPSEISHLLEIKNGKLDLQSIIDEAENMYAEINDMFSKCNLPERVDDEMVSRIYFGAMDIHNELPF
jgi:predicted nucleotidyltransferase